MVLNTKLEKQILEKPLQVYDRDLWPNETQHFSELEKWLDETLSSSFSSEKTRTSQLEVPEGYFQHIVTLVGEVYQNAGWKVEKKYGEDHVTRLTLSR